MVNVQQSNFSRSVASNRADGIVNQTERVGGPSSPSKKYGDQVGHSLSLHPVIVEEAAESLGSTAKKNRIIMKAGGSATTHDDDDSTTMS